MMHDLAIEASVTARAVASLVLPYCPAKSSKQLGHRKQAISWLIGSARETKCLDVWVLFCSISR